MPLVWVPAATRERLPTFPQGLEIAETPERPEESARLDEVEMVVVGMGGGVDLRPLFPKMSRLKVVQTLSAGVDWIVDSVPPGVVLCSARGAYDIPVADWVMAAVLADFKEIPHFRDEQAQHRWSPQPLRRVADSTVLLLGYGSIARAVEQRLAPFRTKVIRVARRGRPGVHTLAELPVLLGGADVVVVLLPLTSETRRLIDGGFLAAMKQGALLVNAARGQIVDTEALMKALGEERLRAVLDVTDPEPLPGDHPLYEMPNVLVTPHVAGGVIGAGAALDELIADQLERFARGEALRNVADAGY